MRTARINNAAALGRILREARNRTGMTQQQMSDELGVSKRYVVEMEQGKPTKAVQRLFDYLRTADITLYGELSDE